LPIGAAADNDAHRCPLYFAQQAANRGVAVYVIGLGYGVNSDYLRAVANMGGGQYYFSASGADLELIFAEILNNIFVRLVK
jgi:secreted protein with Ig-like and vWFA domain